jgi:uncharacterized OB-fold protein
MISMQKPLPVPTPETRTFWESCAKHKLIYQSCQQCGYAQFPPRPVCITCRSERVIWKPASGRGKIYSFTVVHRPPTEAFKSDVPYVIALIDLNEGVRMMMNVRNADPARVKIGQTVKVIFEPGGDGTFLPQAELVKP